MANKKKPTKCGAACHELLANLNNEAIFQLCYVIELIGCGIKHALQ